jgi:hypothetical protein
MAFSGFTLTPCLPKIVTAFCGIIYHVEAFDPPHHFPMASAEI